MLRVNENVKGININRKEFLLSQYADDTQIFLNCPGTRKSLQEALSVSDKFYGLKLNIEKKTKAIWIGSLSNFEIRICRNHKLDWTQEHLKILGVTFTTEVFDIWDVNVLPIINKVESLLNQWSKRKLTLFGPGHAKSCLMSYANNKGADQPAHPRSLIGTFVVR